MPLATVQYVDPTPLPPSPSGDPQPHWSKVEGPFQSFALLPHEVSITEISAGEEPSFDIDVHGFALHRWPLPNNDDGPGIFSSPASIRERYYPEVEALLHARLGSKVKKVVIFDHTLRRMDPEATRKPVMQVHVDQTFRAAVARVKRHLPPAEAETLLKSRFSLLNVWRPIGVPAIEYPLAMLDFRTLEQKDLVVVDLLYPVRDPGSEEGGEGDVGREVIPENESLGSREGYEVRGETYGIAPNQGHRFYYKKDMKPEEVVVMKCADSKEGVAGCCAHTAFVDPGTPKGAPRRRSIEVRCLVFF